MSEKEECPRCGSYVSEVYYDDRHAWCGWNCGPVVYKARLEASGPRFDGRGNLAEMEVWFDAPLTDEQVLALRSAFTLALDDAWGEHDEPSFSVCAYALDGYPGTQRKSPWWFVTLADAREWLEAHPPQKTKWTTLRESRAYVKRIADFYGLPESEPATAA